MFPIKGDILPLICSLLYYFLLIVLMLNFSHLSFILFFPLFIHTTVLI